jgi:hypothetical protein
MPYDPAPRALRAADADREAAAERLRIAAMEGRLDHEELEDRLAAAYAARYCNELTQLTADVTPPREPPPRLVFVRPPATNGLAVVSLVLAILWMGALGSLIAVVLGHLALRQIARSGGNQGGRGVAYVGLTLGYLGLVLPLLWLLMVVLPGVLL